MFDKQLPTFDVTVAFMLFLLIYIAQAASKLNIFGSVAETC